MSKVVAILSELKEPLLTNAVYSHIIIVFFMVTKFVRAE